MKIIFTAEELNAFNEVKNCFYQLTGQPLKVVSKQRAEYKGVVYNPLKGGGGAEVSTDPQSVVKAFEILQKIMPVLVKVIEGGKGFKEFFKSDISNIMNEIKAFTK